MPDELHYAAPCSALSGARLAFVPGDRSDATQCNSDEKHQLESEWFVLLNKCE